MRASSERIAEKGRVTATGERVAMLGPVTARRAIATWIAVIAGVAVAAASLGAAAASGASDVSTDRDAVVTRRAAIERFETFLEKYPTSANRCEVLFTLGELHAADETERALGTADGEASDAESVTDSIPHEKSSRCLREVVDRFPEFARREEALYRLAFLCADSRNDREARAHFETLLREFPAGVFAAATWTRLGEIALRGGDPAAAANAFRSAIARGADPRPDRLHYRLGWALYRAREYSAAREALLAGIESEGGRGSDASIGFLGEMIHLLAVIHSEPSEIAGAERVADQLPPAERRAFLADLGRLLAEDDRAAESTRVLDRALAEDERHDEAPSIAQAAIDASFTAGQRVAAAERMIEFSEQFGEGGGWRQGRALDGEERARLDAAASANAYRAGAVLYEAARDSTGSGALRARAEEALRAAVDRFAGAPERDESLFLLGEIERSGERWSEAAAHYAEARVDRVSEARREPLRFGRIVALEGMRQAATADTAESQAIARRQIAAIDEYLAAHPVAAEKENLAEKRADLLAFTAAHDDAAAAYASLFENEPPASERARTLAGKRAAELFAAGRSAEAAEWFQKSGDAERAAAAQYDAAERESSSGRSDAAGLALVDLVARHPSSPIAFAAALDAIEHLARASRFDTLAAWVATLPQGLVAGTGRSDSLQHVLVAAAVRAGGADLRSSARLYTEASRYGEAEGRAFALAAAAEIHADSLGDTAEAIALFERARPLLEPDGPSGLRATVSRRLGHLYAASSRESEALAAFDRVLALRADATSDSIALDREIALAAIEKGDLLAGGFTKRVAGSRLSKKTAPRAEEDARAVTQAYDRAAERAFRDLTPRACWQAAEVSMILSGALYEGGLAHGDASLLEKACVAASVADGYRATIASLPADDDTAWREKVASSEGWRAHLVDRATAFIDSSAGVNLSDVVGASASAAALGEKALAKRILRLDELARFARAAHAIATGEAVARASATLALRRGAFYAEMIALLEAVPAPDGLSDEGRAEYANAIAEKTAAWRATERDCYREEIARAAFPAALADAVPAAEPAWLAELRLRLAALEAPDGSESPLTRNP
jgi:TolA-binding protein